MFIEDEAGTRSFFARKRFTCQCSAELVGRETTEWRTAMSLFKRSFGKVFDMIQPLPDFALFCLIPDGWSKCGWSGLPAITTRCSAAPKDRSKYQVSRTSDRVAKRLPGGKSACHQALGAGRGWFCTTRCSNIRCASRLHFARKERRHDECDPPIELYDPYGPGDSQRDFESSPMNQPRVAQSQPRVARRYVTRYSHGGPPSRTFPRPRRRVARRKHASR